jgi:cyclomaltodextrinase / maltogenic alpha-amylase / neopullulanase
VLSSGDIEFLTAKDKMLAYKRFDSKNEIIVLFNLESQTKHFTLPGKAVYINLLTNKIVKANSLSLNTLSAAVLKRKN